MQYTAKNKYMGRHKKIGALGEQIAAKYLEKHGHTIETRNYARKWGEIDIVTRETNIVHFVEVKTVSHETREALEYAVTHETWRPEELVHRFKVGQIRKMVETWVLENEWRGDVQIDVVAVRVVPRERFAVVNHIDNIVVE